MVDIALPLKSDTEPAAGITRSANGFEQGAFTVPIGSEYHHHLTGIGINRNLVKRLKLTVKAIHIIATCSIFSS
jgi:hypothetical protein